MRTEDATPRADQTIRLADYSRPNWLIEETKLVFDLHPTATHVRASLTFVRNSERAHEGAADLRLDGHSMTLIAAAVDGADVMDQVVTDGEGLSLPADAIPQDRFVWTCETEIDPSANTSLEGLYLSNGMYCTQCEAEGFRKITYYPDRPDVMTRFHVRIEADKATPRSCCRTATPRAKAKAGPNGTTLGQSPRTSLPSSQGTSRPKARSSPPPPARR